MAKTESVGGNIQIEDEGRLQTIKIKNRMCCAKTEKVMLVPLMYIGYTVNVEK